MILLPDNEETRKVLNQKSREEMKLKLLKDIKMDLQICELEGWNKKEYLTELKELIDSFFIRKED